jgi:hypothetical protein
VAGFGATDNFAIDNDFIEPGTRIANLGKNVHSSERQNVPRYFVSAVALLCAEPR